MDAFAPSFGGGWAGIQLQLEGKAMGTSRRSTGPWPPGAVEAVEDWDEEQGEMQAFQGDVRVHGVAYGRD